MIRNMYICGRYQQIYMFFLILNILQLYIISIVNIKIIGENMYFLYKDNDGVIGKVSDVNLLPKGLKKLIVKEYDGHRLKLPHTKEIIVDANLEYITDIELDCDILKIYNLGEGLYIPMSSKIREITHIDMRMVTDMDQALMNTTVRKICELDYSNVVFSTRLFYGSKLTDIPPMKNYGHLDSDIFERSSIPTHKEQTWRKLMDMNKQRCL